jgi:hypothetical protein
MALLRHPPQYTFSGLTIVLSNPSRFDKHKLLDGNAGWFFNNEILAPDINRYQCDIRLVDDKSPLFPGTKCVLLLGQRAQSIYTGANTTIDENRGSPFIINGIPTISSFSVQDCFDMQNYEAKFNADALAGNYGDEMDSEEIDAGEMFESKGRGRTSRANYKFWLKADVRKCIRIINNNGQLPKLYDTEPCINICPDPDGVISKLRNTKGQDFFFDMETDFISLDMRCFGFCFGNDPFNIYVVPILTPDYKPYYGRNTFNILRALCIATRDNCIVAHNGAAFDFFVLAYKLGIPIGRCAYDTMLSQHRIFPKPEKSLGHCISYWLYEPYHKNEGIHGYHNQAQLEQLLTYCGKDVFTMYLVKKAQLEFAAKDAGLLASIQQANDAIRPYLTATLQGMHFNENKRQAWIKENDRLMFQMLRIMRMLTGPSVEPLISNKKCVDYFHKKLGYKAVSRTKSGNESLNEDALLKLRLQYDNPVIDFLLRYRQIQKETGVLQFKVWKEKPTEPTATKQLLS